MADIDVTTTEEVTLVEELGRGLLNFIAAYDEGAVAESLTENLIIFVNENDEIEIVEIITGTVGGEGATEVEDGKVTSDEISAVGLFTKGVVPKRTSFYEGYLNISVSGTFVGTIVLQRSFDKGVTWHTVASYTVPTESSLTDKEISVRYRLGCPTSWTSGTALCRLGIGG